MRPVIIGVADIKRKDKTRPGDGSDEPASLIYRAIQEAIKDTGLKESGRNLLQSKIDSISVVRPWSWPYPDLTSLLAEKLKVNPTYKFVSPHGGNQPAKLLDEASRRISKGETRVALITGGEALDSLGEYVKAETVPPPGWTPVDFESFAADALKPPSGDTLEGLHGLGAPIQVYALYENGLRAKEKDTFARNHDESAQMYSEFAQVSASNPFSWHSGQADSKETIGTVSARNRMINTPYTMLMCAFNKVNIAGACIVTSSDYAKELGIDESKWVYVRGGAGIAESEEFYLRPSFHGSDAIKQSIDAALEHSEVTRDQIDLYDFYSCFPVVPKLACRHLNLPTSNPPKPITLLGGLTSFGGAGNNYSMHAITAMARQLRIGHKGAKTGLILANGGVLSYQHVVILSSSPRTTAYPSEPPLPDYCERLPSSDFAKAAEGDALIETYTVDFSRKGHPRRGHVIGRLLHNNHRFIANHADEFTLKRLADTSGGEVVGIKGRVFANPEEEGQNLFSLLSSQKL
jgi:acetyl-CoA acetyltransferase